MVTYPDFVAVNACKVRIGSVFRRIRDDDFNWEVIAVISMKGVAFPRRVFTLSQVKYVADRMKWLYDNRDLIGGLEFVEEPPVLRFFMGKLRAKSDWPEKLAAKYRRDFGESL